jgi:predicted nucleic acid-binding protein
MKYVVDCSTAVKWEIPEADSGNAIALRDAYRQGVHELIAPDIFPAEVGNAAIVAEREGRLRPGQFAIAIADILATCPGLHESVPLVPRACAIIASVRSGFYLSFYDALYVALAEREHCELVSGDTRLVRNLQAQYPFVVALSSLP